MTSGERAQIQQLENFMRDWRKEDAEWKKDTGTRLRAVEDYVVEEKAKQELVDELTDEASESNRMNRSQILTALGIAGSFVLGLLNFLSKGPQ